MSGDECLTCGADDWETHTFTGAQGHLYGYCECVACGYVTGVEVISHAYTVSS